MSRSSDFLRRLFSSWTTALGAVLLFIIVVAAIFGPIVYTVDPFEMLGRPAQLPSARFPLGTDVSGRDILAGILNGARVSLIVGLAASLGATLIGIVIGALSGYFGGLIDDTLMRITDFFLTVPNFVLLLVIVSVFTSTIEVITLAIAFVSWPSVARLVRSEFASHASREYVHACRGLGMSHMEIMGRQILPNVMAPIIVVSSLMVASAILTEAGLSFLGLSDPDIVSWGYMIGVGRTVLRSAWWMAAIPGVMIVLAVLAINLVGEGLNDALNPRMRQR
ncbi:ABC transporter permease [Pseudooceanicola nanhaiensis]|uniref:ABC transporter permease n=1 Tax=Pseudooceanicola nanhaiensis TaxID=375761 RepID=UPI001CD7B0C6|nr:ABC transporter permease [Pseudooceanicola nanhaiensis]MCA0918785.1 ABC transporter permease [Pseudooceanicola nanhaiensis]